MADISNAQRSEIETLVKSIVAAGDVSSPKLVQFKKQMLYDDSRYYAMKFMLSNLKQSWKREKPLIILHLIKSLCLPKYKDGEKELTNFLAQESGKMVKLSSVAEHKRLYTFLWLEFLKRELPVHIHKEVLTFLPSVMKQFTNPLQLSDYLTESYNMGGVISLLALNGLFILVNSYNLDYPNFYTKVYALLQPDIFNLKYKARFLYLLDLFLSSTHLPAHLVAAFIKKMSRLALSAPPESLLCVLPMIRNWLARHPTCNILLHRPGAEAMAADPYDPFELDPVNSRAIESSLWEIKCLQEHHFHAVATEAKKFEDVAHEQDLSDLFETKIDELVTREQTKIAKKIPFNPPGLSTSSILSDLWQLK